MAKPTTYKVVWISCQIGKELEIENGWEFVQIVIPPQEPGGMVLMLLKGAEK